MSQIRLNRTPEIDKVLAYLQNKYHVLSEAEILKIALAEKYNRTLHENVEEGQVREAWDNLLDEGKKIGDRLLAEKGLKREDVTEEQFYDLFLDDHK